MLRMVGAGGVKLTACLSQLTYLGYRHAAFSRGFVSMLSSGR